MDNESEGSFLRKANIPSPSNQSLPIVLYLGVGPCETSPFHVSMLLLTWYCCSPEVVHITIFKRNYFIADILAFWVLKFFHTFFWDDPWSIDEDTVVYMYPLQLGSHNMFCTILVFCDGIHFLQRGPSWWGFTVILICGCKVTFFSIFSKFTL